MMTADKLIEQSDALFDKRTAVLSLWQTLAENFYPERADFTSAISIGDSFAENLMSSYPVLVRRDLGNAIGSMLRPTSKKWFHLRTHNFDHLDANSKSWLEMAADKMRKAMHDRKSQFARATKEADHDFATFGQAVIQISPNKDASQVLYRCWHLRDCAWVEDSEGRVTTVHRRWKPTARDLMAVFGEKNHQAVVTAAEKEPHKEIGVRHCIMPAEHYELKDNKHPFVSVYYDVENKHILEAVGIASQEYMVPRWSTVSGSVYAYSPAAITALPDARMLQDMTRVLLEAGEKATNPPMLAVQEAIRGDISIFPGGITWVDAEYDERLGEVLRPMTNDKSGIPLGMDMAASVQGMLAEAFFLNKLNLPQPGQDMTAYEVGQRVQEYIRHAMPLFAPLEEEYNGPLCEATFDVLMRLGAFGAIDAIPEQLRGADVTFQFESPLHDAVEREKGQRFLEAQQMLAGAAAIDPDVTDIVDVSIAARDVLESIGVPSKWTRTDDEAKTIAKARAQQIQAQQALTSMQQGANIAKTMSQTTGTPTATNVM